jgi:Ser-tRNA(Ala) deacylase AlaX
MTPWQANARQWHDVATVLRVEPDGAGFKVWTTPTVLYPEGGGQPADHGWIGAAPVIDVQRIDGEVVHRCTEAPPLGDATVRVDVARRWDHMQQHTGQHLLTAVLRDRFGWETTSFHLGPETVSIELGTRDVDSERLAEAEGVVAAVIRDARPVRNQRVGDVDPAAIRSRLLPAGFQGELRLVEIEGIDLNTCGGTHVGNTVELGALAILGHQPVGARGTRVTFAVGDRLRRRLAAHVAVEDALALRFSARGSAVVELVDRQAEERRALARRVEVLEDAAVDVLVEAWAGSTSCEAEAVDLSARQLALAAARMQARWTEGVAVLWVTDGGLATGTVVLVGEPSAVKAWGTRVAEAGKGRGGGPPGRFQAKVNSLAAARQAWQEGR